MGYGEKKITLEEMKTDLGSIVDYERQQQALRAFTWLVETFPDLGEFVSDLQINEMPDIMEKVENAIVNSILEYVNGKDNRLFFNRDSDNWPSDIRDESGSVEGTSNGQN